MKPALYVYLVLLLLSGSKQTAYAQSTSPELVKKSFTRGQWQLGLKDGYGRGDLLRNHNNFQVHTGYYLADKLLVGLGANWSKEWEGDFKFNDFTVGPLARYQFTRTRVSPFIEASYQFGRRSTGSNSGISYPSVSIKSAFITPGLSIGVASSLRVDISYGFQYLINGYTAVYGQPQVGINYLFGIN